MATATSLTTIHHEVALANTVAELARLRTANVQRANFVSVESYLAWLPNEQVVQIFEEIGSLQSLQTFRISFSFQQFRQLPVLPIPSRALIRLLHLAHHLETLTLDECRFIFPRIDTNHNDDDDLLALATAFQQSLKLRHVTLFNCYPQIPDNNNNHNHFQQLLYQYSQLAQGIAQIPSIHELNVIFTVEGPVQWIQSLLKHSCDSNTLRILRINVPDGYLPIHGMCQALHSNSALQHLGIRCPLDQSGGIALARALSSPQNNLQELYVQMKSYDFAIPIVQSLPESTLRSLELRVWTGGNRTPLLQTLEAVLPNQTTLQRLVIDNGNYPLTPTIEFYLALNRAGRRSLLQEGEHWKRQQWIDFIMRDNHGNDNNNNNLQQQQVYHVSVLFYTLSLNPSLLASYSCQGEEEKFLYRQHKRQKTVVEDTMPCHRSN